MKLTSPAFDQNGTIPDKYTCQGDDINPELHFENVPDGTERFALIVDDPDAPAGTWLHWLVYDIPADKTTIEENSIPGKQGMNDFDKRDYGGPCPPSGEHRYFFRGYALDEELELEEGRKRSDVESAMEGHVIGSYELIGKYSKS